MIDVATRDDLEEHHARLRSMFPKTPLVEYDRRREGGTGPVSGPLIIDLGMPPMNIMWSVQWVAVAPADPTSAAIPNLTGALFIGPWSQSRKSSAEPGDLVVGNLGVPGNANVPDLAIVRGGDHLYASFAGTALPAQQLVVIAGVLKVPNSPEGLAFLS